MKWPSIGIILTGFIAFVLGGLSPIGSAQEKSETKLVKKTQRIVFVDAENKAIEGVTFKPFGLNTSYFWPNDEMGQPPNYVSDASGAVLVEYPESFGGGKIRCESIDGQASHPKYVSEIARLALKLDGDITYQMKEGLKLVLQGIDEDGKNLKECMAFMSGDAAPTSWVLNDNGSIESQAISLGHYQLLLVHPVKDGPTLFSDCLIFQFNEQDRINGVLLDDIEMLPGTRVTGQLDPTIPRPILNGKVMAFHAPIALKGKEEFLIWNDWAPIAEDGTFAFASMPREGKIQFIAFCDGWGAKNSGGPTGELVPVEGSEMEVTLKLEPTFQAVVRVVDETGKPLPGVRVVFYPNQYVWERYSTILGVCRPTIDFIRSQLNLKTTVDEDLAFQKALSRFEGTTNDEGVARIENLPRRNQSLMFVKEGFVSPPEARFEVLAPDGDPSSLPQEPNTEIVRTFQMTRATAGDK